MAAWNPSPYFTEKDGVTTIPMRLAGETRYLWSFHRKRGASLQSLTCGTQKLSNSDLAALNSSVYSGNEADKKNVSLTAPQPGAYRIELSTGGTSNSSIEKNQAPLEINGRWDVSFPPNLGAPAKITLDRLMSLSEHADPGVKYFSGTATYSKTINIPSSYLGGDRRVILDLGEVAIVAKSRSMERTLASSGNTPIKLT